MMKFKTLYTRTLAGQRRIDAALAALAISAIVVAPIVSLRAPLANANNAVSYDFNTAGSLATDFNLVGTGVSQSATGGIGNSGAINAPSSADAIYSSKSSYSLGPVGSTYVFESFLQSVGNSGYSGVGFTASSPAVAGVGGVYRPSDAIGISVHGGGFVFHNGSTDLNGNWGSNNFGITTIKASTISDLLNSGSPQDWYKVVFKIVRDSSTTFDTRVEVWSADSSGALLRPSEADAIFEVRDIQNATLLNAPAIYSYINFSGDRVRYFDNFSINLSGGATVVAEGAPVVLTSSAQVAGAVATLSGNLLSAGTSTLVEKGFVVGASQTPVVNSDTKITVSGNTTGSYSGNTSSLSSGNYFARAFASTATQTSYGVAVPFTISGPVVTELVGEQNVATVCGANGPESTLAAWTHNSNSQKNPQSGFDSKWATPTAYTTTGVTSTIPGSTTATDLTNVPSAKSDSFYVAYPFTTGANTRVALTKINYGDSVATPINLQAKLFSISGGVATEVSGAASADLTTTSNPSPEYIAEDFAFPRTLLTSNQTYELRLYVWGPSATFTGFDDFAIKFESCLPNAPTISTVTPSSTSASVAFVAPTLAGGSAISNYEYSIDNGQTWITRSPASTSSPLEITGLTAASTINVKLRAVTVAGAGVASTGTSATLDSVNPQCSGSTAFDLPNYARVGLPSTYTPALTDGVVELTPAEGGRAGAVWSSKRINLTQDFSIDAEIKISGGNRADGLAFVLQPNSATSLASGGGLGYAGTTPSMAVEFDTWDNVADSDNNHIALMKDGNAAVHNAWGVNPYAPSTSTFNLESSTFTKVNFGWNATDMKFTVKVDLNRNGSYGSGETIFNEVSMDLPTYFTASNGIVYWGFTGATGGSFSQHLVKLNCANTTPRVNQAPVVVAPAASLLVEEVKTISIALQDDLTTQAQWQVQVTSPSPDVLVQSTEVISETEARVTIKGVALSTAALNVVAVDADGDSAQGVLNVTVGTQSSGAPVVVVPPEVNPLPPAPRPNPTPSQTPSPSTLPQLITPTPTPTPTGQGGSVLMPILEPTPNVVYGPTNPIPQEIVDVLRAPLAYVLELLSGSPELPTLTPTESIAYENGSPVEIQLVENETQNGYLLIGDGWQVALEATDSSGEPLILDDSGNIILNQDRFVQFSGTGFAPGSIVKVWLFSEPTELSDVVADANGNFVGKALIPEGIPTGEHTIQLNGLTKDGQLRSVALGVLIQPELVIAPAPPAGFDLTGLMNLLWLLAAAVLVFFFILWRRRKKKDQEQDPASAGSSDGDLIFASEAFEPTPQMPNDSRRKIGPGAPPNRKRFSFRPKNT